MNIKHSFITQNQCYKNSTPMTVRGLILHSIGCPQPSAEVFSKRWNDPTKEVAAHAMVDGNSSDVWQFLPWDIVGWHAGGTANKSYIGVEMGEPAAIKYTSGANFTISEADKPAAREMVTRTYEAAAELFAYLCEIFAIEPRAAGSILSHSEAHARGKASNHADPEHIWRQLELSHTMGTFRARVAEILDVLDNLPRRWYEVQRGDTLYKIAGGYGVPVSDLANFNGLLDSNVIKICDKIAIPTRPHVVRRGDTLTKIARQYKTTVDDIAARNKINNPNIIYVGQILGV